MPTAGSATAATTHRANHSENRCSASGSPPAGWNGKNWACHQLSAAAQGDWLLFTDADLVSLLPRQRLTTIGERLSLTQLPLIIHACLPLCLVPRSGRWAMPFAGAFGPYLLFRRAWYDRLGGHAAVRGALGEDMHFAVTTKRQGRRLVLADGCTVLACHMYANFGEVWRGFTRNAYPATPGAPIVLGLFALLWAALFVLPPVAALALTLRRLHGWQPANGPLARLALIATGVNWCCASPSAGATAGRGAMLPCSRRAHAYCSPCSSTPGIATVSVR